MKSVMETAGPAGGATAVTARLAASVAVALAIFSPVSWGDEPAPARKAAPEAPATRPTSRPARKNVKLPGLVINFQKRCLDLEATVCLDEGFLELIACTKGTKEHESIVVIKARPMHVHAGLLLLGANPGNPAMRKRIGEKDSRWVHVPPRGDPVDVALVFKNKEGKMVEYPISRFVAPSEKRAGQGPGDGEKTAFPDTVVFAGSRLSGDGPGPRKYLSDLSGNVISIASFGDEVLCLPGIHGQENGSLMWQVNAAKLPKVGSKVTLRLRPRVKPAPKAGKAGQARPAAPAEKSKQ